MYRLKYDPESDVLMIVVSDSGNLSHAEEMGDIVIHLSKEGEPLFLEVLNASRNVPLMVQALAKKEVAA
ncbi:DUF2283 domain-containing protein [Candidatus Bathyarchaeota archaeon]|nr:DUF2283 domain-containing protein [Candidatus Bathyarchaeota archaeon]